MKIISNFTKQIYKLKKQIVQSQKTNVETATKVLDDPIKGAGALSDVIAHQIKSDNTIKLADLNGSNSKECFVTIIQDKTGVKLNQHLFDDLKDFGGENTKKTESIFADLSKKIDDYFQTPEAQDLNLDEINALLTRQTIYDELAKDISSRKVFSNTIIVLPDGEETNMRNLTENIETCVENLRKKEIITEQDFLEKRTDLDVIAKIKAERIHFINQIKYNELFHPLRRMLNGFGRVDDPYLKMDNPEFYRIISPPELDALIKTKDTGEFIDAFGHYTTEHYSCITANPNYNEQAFIANGTPIRLKFKTKNPDGSARMEFFDRIDTLKSDHSVYRIFGYNFNDIDWTQTCIATADGWENISKHV